MNYSNKHAIEPEYLTKNRSQKNQRYVSKKAQSAKLSSLLTSY